MWQISKPLSDDYVIMEQEKEFRRKRILESVTKAMDQNDEALRKLSGIDKKENINEYHE
ncbi:hypothetical protein D3C71_2183100 [compost metagenome]